MNEFQIGDVVKLKSGGPVMTIQNLGDYSGPSGIKNGAFCIWFDGNKQQTSVFEVVTLVKAEPAVG